MRSRDQRVPIEQLIVAIEDVLKAGPRVTDELARELGYSVSALRPRLEQLALENRAHRRRVEFEHWSGVCYRWHYGAAVDALVVPDHPIVGRPSAETRAAVPFQSTVRAYPAINRRDPLVAALFGHASSKTDT